MTLTVPGLPLPGQAQRCYATPPPDPANPLRIGGMVREVDCVTGMPVTYVQTTPPASGVRPTPPIPASSSGGIPTWMYLAAGAAALYFFTRSAS